MLNKGKKTVTTTDTKDRKPGSFECKNWKTDLKNDQNRKPLAAPFSQCLHPSQPSISLLTIWFFSACPTVRSQTPGTRVVRKSIHSTEELSDEARDAHSRTRTHWVLQDAPDDPVDFVVSSVYRICVLIDHFVWGEGRVREGRDTQLISQM